MTRAMNTPRAQHLPNAVIVRGGAERLPAPAHDAGMLGKGVQRAHGASHSAAKLYYLVQQIKSLTQGKSVQQLETA